MKRTQLNFDEKTYYQLVSYASREKTSLSKAVRILVNKQLDEENEMVDPASHPLLGLIELGKKLKIKLPKDTSLNHDYYLYGEGSPKFGSKRK